MDALTYPQGETTNALRVSFLLPTGTEEEKDRFPLLPADPLPDFALSGPRALCGSPLLDDDGLVLGLLTEATGPEFLAIPASFLQRIGPGLAADTECPYPSLAPFTVEQARWFYGRDTALTRLGDRLARRRGVLVLAGPPGSGRTSLVAAGLPAILDKEAGGADLAGHQVRVVRPSDGRQILLQTLQDAQAGRCLAVVDEAEELLSDNPALAGPVLEELETVAAQGGCGRVLLVLRDDSIPEFTRCSPVLAEHWEDNRIVYVHAGLTSEDITHMIVGPARSQGWSVEQSLIDRLLKDLADPATGTVPAHNLSLLALSLRGTWERAAAEHLAEATPDNVLTSAHLAAGPSPRKALDAWCHQAFEHVPSEERPTARDLLTQLVHEPLEGRSPRRSRRRWEELVDDDPRREHALKHLVDAGLVTVDADPVTTGPAQESSPGPGTYVRLVHEVLPERWQDLVRWRVAGRTRQRWLDQTHDRTQKWIHVFERRRATRPPTANPLLLRWRRSRDAAAAREHLLRGTELHEAIERSEVGPLPRHLETFLRASRARASSEERWRRRNHRSLIALTCAALFLASGTTWWSWNESVHNSRLRNHLRTATANGLASQALALRQRDPAAAQLFAVAALEHSPTAVVREAAEKVLIEPMAPVLAVLDSRGGLVNDAAYSPDGRRVVTGDQKGRVRVWEASNGELLSVFACSSKAVTTVAFLGEDERVAAVCEDRVVRVWNTDTNKLERELDMSAVSTRADIVFSPTGTDLAAAEGRSALVRNIRGKWSTMLLGHSNPVTALRFSPDGKRLASAGVDSTARIWDVASGKTLMVLVGHTATIHDLVYSPDGSLLATSAEDGTTRIWQAGTGRLISKITDPAQGVRIMGFSPDGARIVTADEHGAAQIRSTGTGKILHVVEEHEGLVTSAAFSPDGNALVTSGQEGTVRLWDAATGTTTGIVEGRSLSQEQMNSQPASPLAVFSPDGGQVLTAGIDGTARIRDVRVAAIGGTAVLTGHKDAINSVAFSPGGERLATGGDDNTARIWDTATGRTTAVLTGHHNSIGSVAFSPNGKLLATGGDDGTVRLWDAAGGRERAILTGTMVDVLSSRDDAGIRFSPDGTRIAAAGNDNTARIWDTATGKQVLTLSGHSGPVNDLDFSPDGKRLATAGDNTARVWDTKDGRLLAVHSSTDHSALTVAFSPDGRRLATAQDDTDVRVWDAASGHDLTVFSGHTAWVNEAVFSPDGRLLLTASDDRTARIWDTGNGRCRTVLSAHTGWVIGARFSPDGKKIATISQDARTRIWDTATGRLLTTFTGHTGAVNAVAFSPDGTRVLTGSTDATAQLRSLPPSWAPELCARAGRNLTRNEWADYLGDLPYERQCPQWPSQDPAAPNAPTAHFPVLEQQDLAPRGR